VQLQVAVEKPRAGTGRAKVFERLAARLAHARVHRQAKIVVRAAHNHFSALVRGDGAFVLVECDEIRVESGFHRFLRLVDELVLVAFREQIHEYSFRFWTRGRLWLVAGFQKHAQRSSFHVSRLHDCTWLAICWSRATSLSGRPDVGSTFVMPALLLMQSD
jgi:hypothetical protein